ncbi:MAG: hypothetical protein R3F39_00125 [Myxococcota bacterium]
MQPSPARSAQVIVPPYRSIGLGVGTALIACAVGAIVLMLSIDPRVSPVARVSAGTAGLALVVALLVGARALMSYRGGLFVDPHGARLGIGLMSPARTWWLPMDSIRGISSTHVVRDGDATFTAALELSCGAALVLAETSEREVADEVTRLVADQTGLPEISPAPPSSGPPSGEQRVAIRRGAALQPLVASFGLASALLGGVLLTVAESSPILAILFAPGLALLGLVLLLAALAKRIGHEELTHRGGLWTHRWRILGRALLTRTVAAPHPRWRFRAEPVRGVCLELVTPDGTLVIGSGATPASRDSIEALLEIARAYSAPSPDAS